MRTDRYKEEPIKNKKGRGLLIFLLVLIILLTAATAAAVVYSYRTAEASLSVVFSEASPQLEFGSEHDAMDYVSDSVGALSVKGAVTDPADTGAVNAAASAGEAAADAAGASNENVTAADAGNADAGAGEMSGSLMLDTASLGEKELVYTVSKPLFGGLLRPSKDFTLKYTVTDTEPPLILWNGSGTTLETGTEFDINSVIAYGDNADPEPRIEVRGKVKMKKPGEYPLHITVTDSSGNSAECECNIIVADELPSYEDTTGYTRFRDFVSDNKGEGRSFGIDVSAWQRDVDFEKAKKAGCEFVIIRIGYSTKGKVSLDTCFEQNIKRAKEAGLPVGIYLYSYDNNIADARESAQWVMEKLGGQALELPVAFDWEDFGEFQSYGMSFYDMNRLYDAFADELAKGGYDCMLYGSRNYLEKVWEDTDTRPVWLAHYTDKTDYKGPYMLWQASCTGKISGIDGAVDMDILYK